MSGAKNRGVAVVTGAGRGIGRAVVRRLAAEGFVVAALDRAPADNGGDGHSFVVDVVDDEAVRAAAAEVEESLGPVEVLVNNAGVLELGPVLDTADNAWRRTMAVNVDGVFHASRAFARRMRDRRRGAVVTVTSNAGRVPRAGMAAYCASKAASAMFTQALGLELAPYGIRCNVVAPGSTDTEMQRQLWPDEASGPAMTIAGSPESFKGGVPLGRLADADDVADAVAFLASDRARHITLHQLVVDGGASLGH